MRSPRRSRLSNEPTITGLPLEKMFFQPECILGNDLLRYRSRTDGLPGFRLRGAVCPALLAMRSRRSNQRTRIAAALLAILPSLTLFAEKVPIQSLLRRPAPGAVVPVGSDIVTEGTLSATPLPVGERACLAYAQDGDAAIVLFSSESVLCGRFSAGDRVRIQG